MADGSASLPLPEVAAPGAVVLPPIAALGAAGAGHPDAAAGAMAAKAGGGIERKRRTSFRVATTLFGGTDLAPKTLVQLEKIFGAKPDGTVQTPRAHVEGEDGVGEMPHFDKLGLASSPPPKHTKRRVSTRLSQRVPVIAARGHTKSSTKLVRALNPAAASVELNAVSKTSGLRRLWVHLVSGHNLVAKDRGGTSDPFAVVSVLKVDAVTDKVETLSTWKSEVIEKTLNPVWDYAEVIIKAPAAATHVQVAIFDYDRIGTNEFMGQVELCLGDMVNSVVLEGIYPLTQRGAKDDVRGEIHLRSMLSWELSREDFAHAAAPIMLPVSPVASPRTGSVAHPHGHGAHAASAPALAPSAPTAAAHGHVGDHGGGAIAAAAAAPVTLLMKLSGAVAGRARSMQTPDSRDMAVADVKVLGGQGIAIALRDPVHRECFRAFLEKQMCPEMILFWEAVEEYMLAVANLDHVGLEHGITDPLDKSRTVWALTTALFDRFIADGSEYEVNISAAMKHALAERMKRGDPAGPWADPASHPTKEFFLESHLENARLMEVNFLQRFLESPFHEQGNKIEQAVHGLNHLGLGSPALQAAAVEKALASFPLHVRARIADRAASHP